MYVCVCVSPGSGPRSCFLAVVQSSSPASASAAAADDVAAASLRIQLKVCCQRASFYIDKFQPIQEPELCVRGNFVINGSGRGSGSGWQSEMPDGNFATCANAK